jgi:hypothetical protein
MNPSVAEVKYQKGFGEPNSPEIAANQLAIQSVGDFDAQKTSGELDGLEDMYHEQPSVLSNKLKIAKVNHQEDVSGPFPNDLLYAQEPGGSAPPRSRTLPLSSTLSPSPSSRLPSYFEPGMSTWRSQLLREIDQAEDGREIDTQEAAQVEDIAAKDARKEPELPEQASSTVSASFQSEPMKAGGSTAPHRSKVDQNACPGPTDRSSREKTAPMVSYDISVHPQDQELRQIRAYSNHHSSPASNNHGGIQALVSQSVHLRLLKSIEDGKRSRAARAPDPLMAESSSGPLGGRSPSKTHSHDDSLNICLEKLISQKSARSATEVRRLSSQTAPKQQAAVGPSSTVLTPSSSASLDPLELNASEPEIREPGTEPEASASTIYRATRALSVLNGMEERARATNTEPSLSPPPTSLLTSESEALLFTSLGANGGELLIK